MRKIIRIIAKLILAYLTTVALAVVSGYGITGIELLLPCIFAFAALVYFTADKYMTDVENKTSLKRDIWCSVPVGLIFAIGVSLGSHMDVWNQKISGFGIKDVFVLVMLMLFFVSCALILFRAIDKISRRPARQSGVKPDINMPYWGMMLILLICWMPYYLTMLPGNLGKDTFESIDMCLGNIPWTNHHPIFFTMLIDLVIKLTGWAGSVTVSMAVFTLLHMVAVAATLAYVTWWIKGRYNSCAWIVAGVCFALHPVVAMYSIYISKDVLFSCAVVLLTLKLIDVQKAFMDAESLDSKGKIATKDVLAIAVYSLLTMLLRNNGLLMMAGLAVVMALVALKKKDKATAKNGTGAIALAVLVSIVAFFGFRTTAYNVLNIQPESFAESLSIPLQQVGYVIAESEGRNFSDKECESQSLNISEADIEYLQKLMPFDKVAEVYELGYTDAYKFDEAFDDDFLNEHKGQFMGVWFRMMRSYFPEYVKAYLAQTAGYWHYGETNTLCTQGVWEDNEVGVQRIDVINNVTHVSLYGIIEKLMLGMRKAPLLCILTSMAMQFYALVLLICAYIRQRRGSMVVALVPALLLWVSVMIAAPAFCLFRYTYPLFMLWPVVIMELLSSADNSNMGNEEA